jgi:hypothetical protein
MKRVTPSKQVEQEIGELLENDSGADLLHEMKQRGLQRLISVVVEREVREFLGRGYYEHVTNWVKVPYATYKIVSWSDSIGTFNIRGFVFEQSERSSKLTDHLFSIDDIEDWTGIDFFHQLEDSVESSVENTSYDTLGWSIVEYRLLLTGIVTRKRLQRFS